MFNNLQDSLESAFKNLTGDGKLTEINVATSIKAIRRALVDADVNYKIAKIFTDKVKEEALGKRNVLNSVSPGDLMVKIVNDELVELMGGQAVGIDIESNKPGIVLIAGLQGSGKTTFTGKLARHLKQKRKKKVMVIACDVYRPAAINQLSVVAEQVGAEIYKELDNKNPVEIAQNGIKAATEQGFDVVIVDTAGRLAVDAEMMNEIEAVKNGINPTETLFVVDAMTGQDAVNTAKVFNDRINYDGVVLTKLDGDTRGGAALSIKFTVGKPIKFVSMGEKMDTLDIFHPDRMAQRILGMGDIVSLVEKAQEEFDEKEAKRLESKIKKNKFDFNDFKKQLAQIKKMGNLKNLISMIPGMSKIAKNLDIDDKAFSKIEAIIDSMTPEERQNPAILNGSRKKRIAKGSGNRIEEINQFLRQFDQMRKMMFQMSKMQGKGGNMKMPNMPGGFR
jgi:signal recognition particle subunit SRP54